MNRTRADRPRVVVVGSNFTGLEIATELAAKADVHLVEQADRVAPEFGPVARGQIEKALQWLNIDVHRNTRIDLTEEGQAVLGDGRQLDADAVVWATGPHAGNAASELGIAHDERGRLPVNEMLSTEIEGIWAAGDCAPRAGGRAPPGYDVMPARDGRWASVPDRTPFAPCSAS